MALTEEQKQWLQEDNEKIILCEIMYHNGTEKIIGYFSNYPYVTKYGDSFIDLFDNTVSDIAYNDIIMEIPSISSKIDADTSIGQITFLNANAEYDDYLSFAWEGYPLRCYIGDPSWIRNDFILILNGICSEMTSSDPSTLSMVIKDKREIFNKKVQETLVTKDYVYNLYANNPNIFNKKLNNYRSYSTGIQIDISMNTSSDKIAQVIQKAIDVRPEFSAVLDTTADSHTILVTTELLGETLGSINHSAHDGTDTGELKTNFEYIGVTTVGTDEVPEVVTIKTVADVNGNLNGKLFHIYSQFKTFYVWISVIDSPIPAIDPKVIDEYTQEFDYTPPDDDLDENTVSFIPDTVLNSPVPICLGKCFNIEPKLIDSYNHVYQVHEGPIYKVIEVRADGIVLDGPNSELQQYEINLNTGCIRLLSHPQSTQITCDVIGQNIRPNTARTDLYSVKMHSAASIVEWLAIEKAGLDPNEICAEYFEQDINISNNAFVNTASLGLYIKDEQDISSAITDIMSSVGGFATFGRTNDCGLKIVQFKDPFFETSIDILNEDNILEKGIRLNVTEAPNSSITLGYNKNWTVQDKSGLAAVLSDPRGDYLNLYNKFTKEFSNVIAYNTNIKEVYPLALDTDIIPTLISDNLDPNPENIDDLFTTYAFTEVNRRISIRRNKRYIYTINTNAAPFTKNIGDVITVYNKRFNFNFGKKVLIIGLEERITDSQVIMEVWL